MKRFQSIGTLLSAIIGALVVMLISVFTYSALDSFRREAKARALLADVTEIREILGTAATIRSELALTNILLNDENAVAPRMATRFMKLQQASEASLDFATSEIERHQLADSAATLKELRHYRQQFRTAFPIALAATHLDGRTRNPAVLAQWKEVNTQLIRNLAIESELLEQDVAGNDPFIDSTLKISDAAWNARMDAGRERGLIQSAIIDNRPPTLASLEYLAELKGMVSADWSIVEAQANRANTPRALKLAVGNAQDIFFNREIALRNQLLTQLTNGRKPFLTGEQWVNRSNPGLVAIADISTTALKLCGDRALALASEAQQAFRRAIALMLLSIAVAGFSMLIIARRIIRPLKAITNDLHSQQDHLPTPKSYENRADEIGEFARALRAFRTIATERERLKSELLEQRIAKESAEAASRVKSDFLASMSHELRTPLNAILGFSDVMKKQLYGPLGDERYLEYSEYVHTSGVHLLDLINDVLDLSKIDAGQVQLRESTFEISDLISEAIFMVRDNARGHCSLDVVLEDGLPAVTADKRLIKQILLNLLSNAIKFTPMGGNVTVGAAADAKGISLRVVDTGIGMDALEMEVAFSPYGQIDSKVARKHHGTGLGLPISRGLAELHGGTLIGQSAKGVGTSITLYLPKSRLVRDRLKAHMA